MEDENYEITEPQEESKIISVIDEINRGKEYSRCLAQRHSCLETNVEPNYTNNYELYPDFYVTKTVIPDNKPKYGDCRHVKSRIIDRDELNIDEHIDLLSKPKFVPEKKMKGPYVVRKKVPGPTHRIIELARPNKRHVLDTFRRYGATMQQFCVENCQRSIQDAACVPVREAVYLIKMKKRKPVIEKQLLKLQMRKLQRKIKEAKMSEMQDMIEKIYNNLKKDLLTEATEEIKDELHIRLNSVVSNKLCKMLDRSNDVHGDGFEDRLLQLISDNLTTKVKTFLVDFNINQIDDVEVKTSEIVEIKEEGIEEIASADELTVPIEDLEVERTEVLEVIEESDELKTEE